MVFSVCLKSAFYGLTLNAVHPLILIFADKDRNTVQKNDENGISA